ncbi:hypothetical protein [Demequina activiva]|uniref:LGFP repeat-containing protein n=1 Tax=Demequina activiva TaxID=1582364 RepID=A0A919Q3K4_9MICO|nr:hypothetical protein [Demequina activiva]GIG54944.1 hypothetical protein Dac01nite_16960 [Demequina activiva]
MTVLSPLRSALVALVLALLATAGLVAAAPPSTAADAKDFDPGFLIADELFFDGTAMSAAQVDSFIAAKNPGCAPGRVCLENYRETITSKSANSRCSAVSAGSNRTAGQIIAAVAKACGISPEAILVILQKEQSLVTSTAPSSRAFQAAMGAGCPDTAPCDGNYAGFYEQVYYGAYLLKGYTIPGSTHYNRYAAGKTSAIQYNPKSSCGTKNVYVRNQATHALYVYTPYTPNAAALNNLYGTGDSCSAYGNRNFWRQFTDWFGATGSVGAQVIANYYAYHGGASGWLGAEVGDLKVFAGGKLLQRYEGGVVTWTQATGADSVTGEILEYWDSRGGASGVLGFPITGVFTTSVSGGGKRQDFEGGSIANSNEGGVKGVYGGFYEAMVHYGGIGGGYGWPLTERFRDRTTDLLAQDFQRARIYHSGSSFTAIPTDYVSIADGVGGISGGLGWPLSGLVTSGVDGGGTFQRFASGNIMTSADGTYVVYGGFYSAYQAKGGRQGPLSWPVSDRYFDSASGYWAQDFRGGTIVHTGSEAYVIDARLIDTVRELGGVGPRGIGWPTAAVKSSSADGGGIWQTFSKATITSTSAGAFGVQGGFRTAYAALGGPTGKAGWITSERYRDPVSGLLAQDFTWGTVFHTGSEWAFVPSALLPLLQDNGGVTGRFGMPTGDPQLTSANGRGWFQDFKGALLTAPYRRESIAISGGFRSAYAQLGGPRGAYGWPLTNRYRHEASGMQAVDLQGGTLLHSGSEWALVGDDIEPAWSARGAIRAVGWPTGLPVTTSYGQVQTFSRGLLSVEDEESVLVYGGLLTAYTSLGGVKGVLGQPLDDRFYDRVNSAWAQDFAGGRILHDGTRYTYVPPEFLDAIEELGGVDGALGWPAGAPSRYGSAVRQQFEGGSLYVAKATGGEVVFTPR